MKRLKILTKQIITPQCPRAVERKWLGGRPRQHQIIAADAMPQRSVRKMAGYPMKDHRKIIEGQTVGLYPLNEIAARGEMFADHIEKFVGVKRSDSCDPRIGRFGNDQVILFAAGLQKIPRVVKVETQPRIAQNAAVQPRQIRCGLQNGGFNLHTINALDIRKTRYRGRSHSSTETDNQNFARMRMKDRAEVAE